MDIPPTVARPLQTASRLGEVTEDPTTRSLAIAALGAVVTEKDLTTEPPGISWLGSNGEVNTLLCTGDRFVHARVDRESASATSYPGPVATVEAADVARASGDGATEWRVTTWHVALSDGAVITLRAADAARAEALADFVRNHLLP